MNVRAFSAQRPEDIVRAAQVVRQGGVVVIPTDTVYGLAASVFREESVHRVFDIKSRRSDKSLPILLATAADLAMLVSELPPSTWTLINEFWPGPLTLVLPAIATLPSWLSNSDGTVAVRVPGSRTCLQFIQSVGEPVIGTSANLSGQPAVAQATDLDTQLTDKVDGILVEEGSTGGGIASTVVEVGIDGLRIHRVGAIPADAIRHAVGVSVRVEVVLTSGPAGV